jgi:3-isopropylmalate/(R)-2-methylmalate dehydratase small subunit
MRDLRFRASVWKFGDNVDTDQINPGKYMHLSAEEASKYAFEAIAPDFPQKVKPGEIIVAGSNFGCGSSRETAPEVLKSLGIAVVVAESFGRIFFRNAIAIGLPALTCPGLAAETEEGDEIDVDVERARITNLRTGKEYGAEPLHEMMLTSLKKGGIMKLLAE